LKRTIYTFLIGLVVLSFLFTALPVQAQDMSGDMGCCQFEGDEPGCWFPTEAGPCEKLEGKFLKGDKSCSMDTGYCSGYKKDGESSTESKM